MHMIMCDFLTRDHGAHMIISQRSLIKKLLIMSDRVRYRAPRDDFDQERFSMINTARKSKSHVIPPRVS
jgi:hypothetical protein